MWVPPLVRARLLRTVVEEKNDRSLDEIASELDWRCKVCVGRSTVWRGGERLGHRSP
jgi:hypothetical protein